KFRIGKARALDDRLVIAGQKTLRFAESRNLHRPKIVLEEAARSLLVGRPCRGRAPADLPERGVDGPVVVGALRGAKGPAAHLERGERSEVIVGGPAVDVTPFHRLELAVRELQRLIARLGAGRNREPQRGCGDASEEDAQTHRHCVPLGYCPASVATSFQLGSREERSRANVHTSVTSVTFSALPSITLPDLSRVTEISCETKRTVICAVRPRSSTPAMSDLSIATKRVSTVSPLVSRSRIAASNPS